ncbi:hypothetical protein [Pantoea rwandensis]|uniref:Uncharacterized protein n=1 Tax=Pantoea rwandensis TaxID=1076550 RepID=A0A1X1CNU6_9GAMM|nr:hypothetical protein [Pantoea rwandensis]ORM66103.1 hypothetical protein HA51_23975 [Pantoea rwandensis]
MNTQSLIIIHLMNHPEQTPAQIAAAIGRTANTVKTVLPAMVAVGDVWRDAEAKYSTAEAAGIGDEQYLSLCDVAYRLQERCLWNRAANVWHEAQKCTVKPGLREKARIKGMVCVEMARLKDPRPEADPLLGRSYSR